MLRVRKFPNLAIQFVVTANGRTWNHGSDATAAKTAAAHKSITRTAFVEVILHDFTNTGVNCQRIGWIEYQNGKQLCRSGIANERTLLKELGQ